MVNYSDVAGEAELRANVIKKRLGEVFDLTDTARVLVQTLAARDAPGAPRALELRAARQRELREVCLEEAPTLHGSRGKARKLLRHRGAASALTPAV